MFVGRSDGKNAATIQEISPNQWLGSMILNDPILALAAASDGLGLLYMTEDVVREHIAAGKLAIVLNAHAASSQGYYLYYPHRSQAQPKLRAHRGGAAHRPETVYAADGCGQSRRGRAAG
jgi:DNA-binding transcriptional LysR family regulator